MLATLPLLSIKGKRTILVCSHSYWKNGVKKKGVHAFGIFFRFLGPQIDCLFRQSVFWSLNQFVGPHIDYLIQQSVKKRIPKSFFYGWIALFYWFSDLIRCWHFNDWNKISCRCSCIVLLELRKCWFRGGYYSILLEEKIVL